MTTAEQAKSHFSSGFNCAESVLLAISREALQRFNDSAESCVPRIATGFGGGIALNGDACGALTGGVLAIGLALGRNQPTQSRDSCYAAVDRLYQDFREEFGTCECCELTGVDLQTAEGTAAHHGGIRDGRCKPIVAWTANRTDQIIQEFAGNHD